MADIRDAFSNVQDKTIGDLFSFMEMRYKQSQNSNVVEHFKAVRAYAEIGLAIYDFSEYLKENSNG